MKRSAGVTAYAVLFFSGGCLTIFSAMYFLTGQLSKNLANSEDRLAKLEAKMEVTLNQSTGSHHLSEERREKTQQILEGLKRTRRMQEKVMRDLPTPRQQLNSVLGGLLGGMAVVAGIGLLLLATWGRTVAIYQASLSFCYHIISGPVGLSYIDVHVSGAVAFIGLLIAFVFPLTWNGIVIWYFLRPGVKAQFQKNG